VNKKFAFVGSYIPEAYSSRVPAMSIAGNMFQAQIIKCLSESLGSAPSVISSLPIATFPKSHSIIVRPTKRKIEKDGEYRLVPFINILFMKQITIAATNFIYLIKWQLRYRKELRHIYVYNLYPPLAIAALASKWLFGGKAIAIILDFPHNLIFEFVGWKGFLQRIVVKTEALCLAHFDAIIPATKYVAEDYCANCPVLVLEGGVDESNDYEPNIANTVDHGNSYPVCLFSGSLTYANGVDLILDSFALLKHIDISLWIFGKGPLETRVRDAASKDKRIVYWGYLENSMVRDYQRKATVLLNTRPSKQLITRYTFPSKLMEYMQSGRPIITTVLPGIPQEYFQYLYILKDETPAGLAQQITRVYYELPEHLDELGRRARDFIKQNKNWKVQEKRLRDFLSQI
jgi:glycosyltransferase involved in cell wall biosynthesis